MSAFQEYGLLGEEVIPSPSCYVAADTPKVSILIKPDDRHDMAANMDSRVTSSEEILRHL